MRYIARRQIKDLFIDSQKTMEKGLWFSGYEDEGEYKKWWDNGQLFRQCFYKNGKLHGEYKRWDEDGKLIVHQIYMKNKVIEDYLK